MPTLRGPKTITDPERSYTALIYLRRNWWDDWELVPELRLVSGEIATGAHGMSQVTVQGPYGSISEPWQKDYGTQSARRHTGLWLRLDLVGPEGAVTEFVGRTSTETRLIEGSDVLDDEGNPIPSGEQTWIAYGPQRILDRIWLHQSYFDGLEIGTGALGEVGIYGTMQIYLEWVPAMNRRDEQGTLWGNRSENLHEHVEEVEHPDDQIYLYGNQATWTHEQYLRYLLKRFVDESLDPAYYWLPKTEDIGPRWTVGGQKELLEGLESVLTFDEPVVNVGKVIRELVNPKYGMDYIIRPIEDGFEIHVFALVAESASFAGEELPLNPNTVEYRAGADLRQLHTLVEYTEDDLYNVIRVIGKRPVVCCSLGGASVLVDGIAGTLVGKWTTYLQAIYEAGTGSATDTPEQHDAARQDIWFEAVFQAWAAPVDWNQRLAETLIELEDDGHWTGLSMLPPYNTPYHQLGIRVTLPWLPLREGWDYSVQPEVDHNPAGVQPDLMKPFAMVNDTWRVDPEVRPYMYQRADKVGIGISALDSDWGLQLSASPNHLLGHGLYNENTAAPSTKRPIYDPDYMTITFAFEADQRVQMQVSLDADQEYRPSAGVLEIYDRDIELWLLAPNTVVGIAADGSLKTSGGAPRVLREDVDRLYLVMAGAIARHHRARARAEITVEGLVPWTQLLGYVLTAVEEAAGDTHDIGAPLTSVSWSSDDDGNATTVIRTGFARSEEAR